MLGGDWLRARRFDVLIGRYDERPELVETMLANPDVLEELGNFTKVAAKTSELKISRGQDGMVKPSLKTRTALIEGISEESDDEVQNLWARLLDDATCDQPVKGTFSFATTLRQFDQECAVAFQLIYSLDTSENTVQLSSGALDKTRLAAHLQKLISDPEVALDRLAQLRCINISSALEAVGIEEPGGFFGRLREPASVEAIVETLRVVSKSSRQRAVQRTDFGHAFAAALAPK
jgi:hypothetical protein